MSDNNNTPLQQLLDYEQRGLRYVIDLTGGKKEKETWRAVAFRAGDIHMALAEHEVAELLTVPQFTLVPGTKRWVKGVANVRGELLPVIDFTDFLFEQPQEENKEARILVVRSGDVVSGLLVSAVFGIRRFVVDDMVAGAPEDLPDSLKCVVEGHYPDEEAFNVISIKKLIDETEFMQAAA